MKKTMNQKEADALIEELRIFNFSEVKRFYEVALKQKIDVEPGSFVFYAVITTIKRLYEEELFPEEGEEQKFVKDRVVEAAKKIIAKTNH